MSAAVSPVTGRHYGLAAVCRTWRVPRATIYRRQAPPREAPRRRPGPSGPMPDPALLAAVRAVLGDSPFHGEGRRKVLCGRPRGSNAFLLLHSASLHSLTAALNEISTECPMVPGA